MRAPIVNTVPVRLDISMISREAQISGLSHDGLDTTIKKLLDGNAALFAFRFTVNVEPVEAEFSMGADNFPWTKFAWLRKAPAGLGP